MALSGPAGTSLVLSGELRMASERHSGNNAAFWACKGRGARGVPKATEFAVTGGQGQGTMWVDLEVPAVSASLACLGSGDPLRDMGMRPMCM